MLPSIKTLFKIGRGPSSSHTFAPYRASKIFLKSLENVDYDYIRVTLYGSLGLTGKGHLTDKVIYEALEGIKTIVDFDYKTQVNHPNTMIFKAYNKFSKEVKSITFISLGGGRLKIGEEIEKENNECYPFSNFNELKNYMVENNMSIRDVVLKFDDKDILDYLETVHEAMFKSVEDGLNQEGLIAGELNLKRVAKSIYKEALSKNNEERNLLLLTSYAYAVAEMNTGGGVIVTAPTCGSAGVIPSIIYHIEKDRKIDKERVLDGLMMAGLLGLIIRRNATISGAVGGCQAEIGSACSMGAALLSTAFNLSLYQVEYASELAMEHNLGLTCDPVKGYVAIPCIERNAIASFKAFNAFVLAKDIAPLRKNMVSLDDVIKVMYETGINLSKDFKETSKGGLAKIKVSC